MGEARVERRLAAILAADVAGYSRLMGMDEVGTLGALKAHRAAVIDRKVSEHNGRIVKTTGDGLLIEFPSVVDAVRCAVEWQEGMLGRNAGVPPEKRLAFRIGVNVGDVIVEAGDVHGDGVNIAARLEQLAEPGGICISRAAYEQVRDKLPYKFHDDGEHSVKNIARPIRVWRLGDGRSKPPAPARPPTRRRAVVAGAAFAVLVGAAAAWFGIPHFTAAGADRLPGLGTPRLSIAVLPFANLSGDKDQDYFADALTEDITADLSRISGAFVISRSSTATYKGQTADAKRVARELRVRYVLDGTVRRAGGAVQVNAQLIDGDSGQQVWSERYEKSAGAMYAFQSEVTGRVARALNLELKDAMSRRAARGRAGNLDAEDIALRGWAELWVKPQSKATNDAAIAYLERATALDSDNSEALGALAYAHARASSYGWSPSRLESIRQGIAAGEKAVALDPKNVDALYALAFLFRASGDLAKSQELLRQCIALNRNHAPSYFFFGQNLLALGQLRESYAWIERAFALSPRDPLRAVWYRVAATGKLAEGDETTAIETARLAIAANRDHPTSYAVLAAALAQQGRIDEAKAAMVEFRRLQPGATIAHLKRQISPDARKQPVFERVWNGLRLAGLAE